MTESALFLEGFGAEQRRLQVAPTPHVPLEGAVEVSDDPVTQDDTSPLYEVVSPDTNAVPQTTEEIFTAIYRRYFSYISTAARSRLPSSLLAARTQEDDAQEAFMALFASLQADKDPELRNPDTARTWLTRVISYKAVDHMRREGLHARNSAASIDGLIDPERTFRALSSHLPESIMAPEGAELIKDMLATLGPMPREIIYRREVLGESVDEIAQVVGKSPGNVRVIHSRAKAALRDNLIRRQQEVGLQSPEADREGLTRYFDRLQDLRDQAHQEG